MSTPAQTTPERVERPEPDPASAGNHPGRITAGELVLVCSHYDLGEIRTVRKLPGGSRSSPKVLLVGGRNAFLLKRRAPGPASEPSLVALTHEIILHLEQRGIPAPRLVGTRDDNNSMLQLLDPSGHSRVYEVYRYVRGRPYARTPADAVAAGALLARVQKELAAFTTQWPIPSGTFHARPEVAPSLESLARRYGELSQVCESLAARYTFASHKAREAGVDGLRRQLVHSDWHPGNLVYKKPDPTMPAVSHIAAILDFDSARQAPALFDAANGAMQCSIGKHSPESMLERLDHSEPGAASERQWHMSLNPQLFQAFWSGFHRGAAEGRSGPIGEGPRAGAVPGGVGGGSGGSSGWLGPSEVLRAVPWLMIQALIVEAIVPIVHTGRFERLEAGPILRMVDRACEKFRLAADKLVELARP